MGQITILFMFVFVFVYVCYVHVYIWEEIVREEKGRKKGERERETQVREYIQKGWFFGEGGILKGLWGDQRKNINVHMERGQQMS